MSNTHGRMKRNGPLHEMRVFAVTGEMVLQEATVRKSRTD